MSQDNGINNGNGSTAGTVGVPRLCHVIKTPKFDGYGFNLHAEKSKPGQFIGKVDEGSPAEAAGLRQGDRILQVNGVDIANETHKQVVERIKQNPNETKLLVISPSALDNDNNETASVTGNNVNNHNNKTTEQTVTEKQPSEPISLKLNMTAAELRAQLATKKKYDPKKESIDFKKKFDIVQTL